MGNGNQLVIQLSKTVGMAFLLVVLGLVVWPASAISHSARTLYNESLVSIQNGNLDSAKRSLRQALSDYPQFAEAHHLLGILLFKGITLQPGSHH